MSDLIAQTAWTDERKLVSLARELAMDIHPVEVIIDRLKLTPDQFQTILKLPRFNTMLADQAAVWGSALNTAERIKIKALAQLEDWMPELHARLHDPKEGLAAKMEGGKLLRSLAGLDIKNADITGGAERFSLTINIGNSAPREIAVTHKVIEAEAIP